MQSWMEIVLFNAATATILAVLVALVAPRIRRPAVVHALWLLVLLKLVTPPVFEVGMVPKWEQVWARQGTTQQPESAATTHTTNQSTIHAEVALQPGEPVPLSAASVSPHADWTAEAWGRRILRLAPFLAGAVTLLLLGLTIVRLGRFRRRLRAASDVPPDLLERLARLAALFGIGQPPRIRIVEGRLPPSLWPALGACEILLPAGLVARLSDEECDALLAHELAHIQRRDHWLRPLELLVVAVYWWHPVAWWARRNLRIAEEQSCDVLVVRTLAHRSRVYAESLLKTVEFLAHQNHPVPLLATGATGTAKLKERITMILEKKAPGPLPTVLRPVLYTGLLLILLTTPAWVEKVASADGTHNPQKQHQEKLLAYEEAEVRLQREMQQLERDRMSLQLKIDEKMTERQLEQMRQEMKVLEQEGQQAEVEQLSRRIASLELQSALHRQQVEAEQAYVEKRLQVEYQLQDLALQMQRSELAGDLQRIGELTERTFKLEQTLRELQVEAMQADLERQRQRFELEKKELEKL